jgi:hypothetical protein
MLDISVVRRTVSDGNLSVPNRGGRLPKDFADSLRTPLLSWFALLIDKNGMDAIKLWSELFPKHRQEINQTWARIEPAWHIIRKFRDRAGFHADKLKEFFRARYEVCAESTELPDLQKAVDEFLDEMEAERLSKYNRAEFKRYLMIP